MPVSLGRIPALCARVLSLLALLVGCCDAAPYPEVPAVAVGTGPSLVVEYDFDFHPLRKYVGFQKPVDITPLDDGTILLVDEDAQQVMVFDPGGIVRWSEKIGEHPLRARPRSNGGLLVTSGEQVIALHADRTVEWTLPVKGVKAAVPLANGHILVASNDGNGWLTEMAQDGTVLWRSKPRGQLDASGHWVDEASDQYFHAMSSLDVAANGTIFVPDFDGGQTRLLSPTYQRLRIIPGLHHVSDTRIDAMGELVTVSPEDFVVLLELPNGATKTLQPEMRPYCANISAGRTVLAGLVWEPERAALNATALRSKTEPQLPWRQQALPVSILAVLLGVAVAATVRWPQNRSPRSREAVDQPREDAVLAGAGGPTLPVRSCSAVHAVLAAVCVTALGSGSYLAWSGMGQIEASALAHGFWRFVLGAVLAGLALRFLNGVTGVVGTLSSFVPNRWQPPVALSDSRRCVTLALLSLGSLAACVAALRLLPAEQAAAVGLWLLAQIWLIAAAFRPLRAARTERASWSVWALLGLVLLGAVVTRFWQIGYYPDFVHHDHSIYGDAALRTLRGDWKPFFGRVYSVGQPWLAICAAALLVFGRHYWVLRLLSAVGGVVLVWGVYLLGTELFNRRIGLIAALLATVNNALLLYSRQPYVLDPVPPFVLAMYCAAVGLRRGCRFHWCVAGILSGWTLLAYYSAVGFIPVGGMLFLYLAVVSPRALWRNRAGLLWMLAGVCVVYLPLLVQTVGDVSTAQRVNSVVVLLNPDGSLRWDRTLWVHQLERSFGAILYYADTAPWEIFTGTSIAMRYGACLFGIGVIYLLTSWWTPTAFFTLAWIVVFVLLGGTALPDPPTFYHLLGAVVPIVFVSAVALDRALALTDGWRPSFWRVPAFAGALVLLAVISAAQVNAVWLAVRRPPPTADRRTVFRANPGGLAARFIRERPEYRYYLVRSYLDVSSDDPLFQFFAADSDLSDMTTDIAGTLPVPRADSAAAGVAFIVLPSRRAARDAIAAAYPGGIADTVESVDGAIWIYRVDAASVRRAYDAAQGRARQSNAAGQPVA